MLNFDLKVVDSINELICAFDCQRNSQASRLNSELLASN